MGISVLGGSSAGSASIYASIGLRSQIEIPVDTTIDVQPNIGIRAFASVTGVTADINSSIALSGNAHINNQPQNPVIINSVLGLASTTDIEAQAINLISNIGLRSTLEGFSAKATEINISIGLSSWLDLELAQSSQLNASIGIAGNLEASKNDDSVLSAKLALAGKVEIEKTNIIALTSNIALKSNVQFEPGHECSVKTYTEQERWC